MACLKLSDADLAAAVDTAFGLKHGIVPLLVQISPYIDGRMRPVDFGCSICHRNGLRLLSLKPVSYLNRTESFL